MVSVAEFKAWFEGFTDDDPNPPNEKRWVKIKQKIQELTSYSYTNSPNSYFGLYPHPITSGYVGQFTATSDYYSQGKQDAHDD